MGKACTKCGSAGPFHKDASRRDGESTQCKVCKCAVSEAWARSHGISERKPAQSPTEKRSKSCARASQWKAAHRERVNAAERARRAANAEAMSARRRELYRANPAAQLARTRKWASAHPEEHRARIKAANARRRGGRGVHVTERQWRVIRAVFGDVCAYCLQPSTKLEQDHVIAVTRGGSLAQDNIVPACRRCNVKKSNRPVWSVLEAGFARV